MTNRSIGRYSYLFEREPTRREAYDFPIQVGYTALCVLKKARFYPAAENIAQLFLGRIAVPADRLTPGNFIVLQDPFTKAGCHDVIFEGSEVECMNFAEQTVAKFRCSTLVAKVLFVEDWH